MAPGDVRDVPRTPSPVAEAGPVARHFRSRARLRRLLAGLRPSTLHRSLRSLRQRGFALYVRLRHYRSSLLAAASNSLTFVRGADRACCAPRKWPCSLICAPCKWRFCLITRRANGDSALSINPVSRFLRSKNLETVPGAGTLPVWGSGGRSAPDRRRQVAAPVKAGKASADVLPAFGEPALFGGQGREAADQPDAG